VGDEFQAAVVLVGEPRAGRSDLIEGLRRTLAVDGTRNTTPAEFDFFDTGQRAEVEVVLGDLSRVLSDQVFYDYIEWWNADSDEIIDELDDPRLLAGAEQVVRLCYRRSGTRQQARAATGSTSRKVAIRMPTSAFTWPGPR
jgi:hypothetical protein